MSKVLQWFGLCCWKIDTIWTSSEREQNAYRCIADGIVVPFITVVDVIKSNWINATQSRTNCNCSWWKDKNRLVANLCFRFNILLLCYPPFVYLIAFDSVLLFGELPIRCTCNIIVVHRLLERLLFVHLLSSCIYFKSFFFPVCSFLLREEYDFLSRCFRTWSHLFVEYFARRTARRMS